MRRERQFCVCILSSFLWLRLLKVVAALSCSDIPPSERVDCAFDEVDEAWCLKHGCCFENGESSTVPKCFYKAGYAPDYKLFQFDNKQYIVTNYRVQRQNLDDRCEQLGSGYKPAYINYKEEYEMLRLGIRLLYGIRGKTQWLEIWLGGSLPSRWSPRYSRSDSYPACPVLAYTTYSSSNTGKTVVMFGQMCSHQGVYGMCEGLNGELDLGTPVIDDGMIDADGCRVFEAVRNVRRIRLVQLVMVSGTASEFRLEISTKGNKTCDRIIFGTSRLSSMCNSMYMRESDLCEKLETLLDEESCYVRCSSGGSDLVNGTLMVTSEEDEAEWALCPLRLA